MAETTSEKKTTAKKTTAKKSTKKAAEEVVEVAQEAPVVEQAPLTDEQVEAVTKVLEKVTDEEPDVQDSGDVMFGQAPEAQEEEVKVDKTEPDVEKVLEDVKIEEEPEDEEVKADEEVVVESIDEFEKAKKDLEVKLEKLDEPDEAEAAIKGQIKNLEAIKARTEKVAKKLSNYQISNSWNGMIQDW